jgi:hypothetical protein
MPKIKGNVPFDHARLSVFRFVQSIKLQQSSLNLEDAIVHTLRDIMLSACNANADQHSTLENSEVSDAPNIITDSAVFLGGNGGGFGPD